MKSGKFAKDFRQFSISFQLALLFILSSTALLSVSCFYLYNALSHDLKSDDEQFLNDQMHFLKRIIHDRASQFEEIKEKIQLENSVGGVPRYFVRLLDEQNRILIESSQMPVPPSEFPELNHTKIDSERFVQKKWQKGIYLLGTGWVMAAKTKKIISIELAADITDDQKILARYRRKVFFILMGGIVIGGIFAVVITRKGLQPVRRIAKAAERITAERLHERVMRDYWPQELQGLAGSFDEMLRRLEKSFGQISQFSADLAHEMRTPLNNLKGQTEVILAKKRNNEEYTDLLQSNLEEYDRLSRLVDELLFLARAENTQIPIQKQVFDPMPEIQAIKEYYEPLAETKGIEIVCEGTRQLFADPILFKRAINNLVSNAIKHSFENEKIFIRTKKLSDFANAVLVENKGREIQLNDLPHIFERFYRGKNHNADLEGVGLGLAIVKSIMDLHSGNVQAQSEPGSGTAFILTFPAQ